MTALPEKYPQWYMTDGDEWVWHRVGHLHIYYLTSQDIMDEDDDYVQFRHMTLRTMNGTFVEIDVTMVNDDIDYDDELHMFVNEIQNTYNGFLNLLFNQEINPAYEI